MRVKVDEDLPKVVLTIVELLQRVLMTCNLESLAGSVAVATPQGIRVRRAR